MGLSLEERKGVDRSDKMEHNLPGISVPGGSFQPGSVLYRKV